MGKVKKDTGITLQGQKRKNRLDLKGITRYVSLIKEMQDQWGPVSKNLPQEYHSLLKDAIAVMELQRHHNRR